MSRKGRASRLEQAILERQQAAFLAWRESLSDEEFHTLFEELCRRLAKLGYLPPPPAGLWSLPKDEKESYFEAFRQIEHSEQWQSESAAMVVRELWLETIGVLERAETEPELSNKEAR